jgi:hypothetical protein
MIDRDTRRQHIHNRNAPKWAAAMILFGVIGLATIWIDLGDFWKGYVLDMVGPAWNYILFRGLFTGYRNTAWTRFFNPNRTIIIFLLVCFAIEGSQYIGLYNATFDPFDLLAYISFLIPLFLIDRFQQRNWQ